MREQVQSNAPPTLHLLGEVRLHLGDGDASPRGRKAQALLAYLAVSPDRSAARERLADLLWTDRGSEQARGSLRQVLAEIRQAGNGFALLTADRRRVAMDAAALATDIECIRDAAGKRLADELARCMERVRGPFLDQLDGLSAGYDEWLHVERPRQHDRVVSAVLEAALDMLTEGKSADLQAIVASLEHLEPLNEAVARLGMRADHARGDLASLHRRFRRLGEDLSREFGSPPSEETRALFARLTALAASEAESAPEVTPPEAPVAPVRSAPVTIIVAPIEADGSAESGELAAICTDDIRAALTRMGQIRVVALDTPDEARLAQACAGAVGAYLLSGRLRRMGDQVLVTIRLGNVENRAILWSEQLRIDAADLFGAIDQVVERAAGAVLPSIDRDLAAKLGEGLSGGGSAALLFTEARIRIGRARTKISRAEALADVQASCALLERVIELDPSHLAARLLLARMYNTDFWQQIAGHDVKAFRARADQLGREAAALEPGNVDVLILRAWCYLRHGEWLLAKREFEKVATLLPFDADTIDSCAFGLCHLGEFDRAEPLFQRAFRLNPFPPADYHADRAVMLTLRGDADAAEEHFEVSGVRGLQYAAVRLSNLGRAGAEKRLDQLRNNFARVFREAWQQPRAPETADVLAWIDDTLPLKRPEHRELVRQGLTGALGDRW